MGQIETVLVGSKTLMREGLKGLLSGTNIHICAEAPHLAEVPTTVASGETPGLILADIAEFSEETSEALREVKRRLPLSRVVVLTDILDATQLSACLSAGVDGFLLKEISYEALLQSLRLVMTGEKVFPTDLAALLVNGTPNPPKPIVRAKVEEARNRGLSDREMQILQCLAQGDSNKIIANRLEITEATVKVHVKSLLRKIQAANRTQAAIWAVNQGIA